MEKISSMTGYKNLAAAVLEGAFKDLPRKYFWVKDEKMHIECISRDKISAVKFFRSGNFRLWADTLGILHEIIIKLYLRKMKEVVFQDATDKNEWYKLPQYKLKDKAEGRR